MPDAELSVLYVDDEVILLEITKLYLTSLGFLVETSDSGPRALKMIENTRYDAIISDYQMPGMDGITLLKEIRSRYPNLPFILFTGRGREDVVIEAIECGADFYLQKGGSPKPQFAELVHKIHRAVQLRREEIALIESEARFNQVAENAGEWIWETDKDGLYKYCSSAIQTILGYQPEELIGKKYFFDLFESETRDAQTSQVQILMKEHHSVKGVFGDYQHKNGEKVILQSSGSAIFNVAGDLIGFRGIHQDVTDQKRNEVIIRLNEKRLTRAQEIGKSGNWEFDMKTGLLWGSENAIRMFGYHRPAGTITVEEIESRIVERDRVHQALVDLVTQGKEYNIEYTVIPADNSPQKTILSIASIEPDEQGAGSKVIGVILDITERKRSEDEIRRMSEDISAAYEELISNEEELRANYQALAQSEKHYRILAENLKDVVWILDTETNQFRYVSPSVLQLRGYTAEEVMAKPIDDVLTPDTASEIKELIKKRAELYRAGKGESYYTNLIEQPCKDGTTIWTEVISSYYTNEETGTVDLRGVTRDITERIAAEKALEKSEERYRTLMQILPVSLCLVHNHTEISYCNDRFTRMLGYTQEDIPTIHDWWEKAYPDEIYRSQVIQEWENSLNEAGIRKSDIKPREYQICKKDGNFRTIEISGILLDDDYLVTMLDVTERKLAEHALMESEAKFRSLIENSLESILIVDFQGNLLFANQAAYRMVEADQGRQIAQMNVMEFIDPVSRQDVARDFAEVMNGHDSYLARYHVITSKGNHIQVESIGKRITYEDKPAIILSVSDVTIRRKAEEALAESQDKYQQLFELGSEAIFLIDNERGNILEAKFMICQQNPKRPGRLLQKLH
jgi:PAS domain S-box-containing protein